MDEWMDGCEGSILGRYHNMVLGLFNIRGRDFNFPIHFMVEMWMDGCERVQHGGVHQIQGRYHTNMVFGLFNKSKGF